MELRERKLNDELSTAKINTLRVGDLLNGANNLNEDLRERNEQLQKQLTTERFFGKTMAILVIGISLMTILNHYIN